MEKLGYPWRQYSNRIVQVVQKTRLHLVNDKRRRRQSLLVESHHQEEEAPAPPRLKWEVDDVGRGEKVGGGCRFYLLTFLVRTIFFFNSANKEESRPTHSTSSLFCSGAAAATPSSTYILHHICHDTHTSERRHLWQGDLPTVCLCDECIGIEQRGGLYYIQRSTDRNKFVSAHERWMLDSSTVVFVASWSLV